MLLCNRHHRLHMPLLLDRWRSCSHQPIFFLLWILTLSLFIFAFQEAVRFIDYAPMVFRKIREFYGISAQKYLQSVGPEQLVGNMVLGNLSSLSELCSEGKSGAFFYYTADGRFMIKTVSVSTGRSNQLRY